MTDTFLDDHDTDRLAKHLREIATGLPELLRIARALADAGLLAPAPLTEEVDREQAVMWPGYVVAERAQRRWVTDWFPAEPEGDGSADQ